MGVFHRIVVPVDFNASSRRALELAVELARVHDAQLTVMHTCEIPIYPYLNQEMTPFDLAPPIEQAARAELERTMAIVRQKVPGARADLRRGLPWQEILAEIEETRADLVVMGTHGRHGVAHVVLGSVAGKIVRLSPVPVLTVRGTTD